MFDVKEFDTQMDLSDFYTEARLRGFENNSSKQAMVDCFNNEREKQVWVLFYNNHPIGSVAAHSFDDVMGPNSYRIAARTCVFTDKINGPYGAGLRTISVITHHQNPTAQFLIPACIKWAPAGASLYITTNKNSVGTQQRVHRTFGPAMEKLGLMKRVKEVEYRGTKQTVWQVDPIKFLEDLKKYPQWK